jgi:methylmalonic aciduria homocystinuria type C protein
MHISGAAWFYQKDDCDPDELKKHNLKDKKVMGVCIHPKYGGYFSARAVVITNQEIADNELNQPVKTLVDEKEISKILIELNKNWKAGLWRDGFGTENTTVDNQKYSEEAQIYFNTIPSERKPLIDQIRSEKQ